MNPWLDIPLEDYEAHMVMPSVGQADFLAQLLGRACLECYPESVAIFGVAGGNGLDDLDSKVVARVVTLDINPDFVSACRARIASRFETFEALVHDLETGIPDIEPVELLFAGLLLEYLDWPRLVADLPAIVRPGGSFVVALQMPSEHIPEVSPTPYTSLLSLQSAFRFVRPSDLREHLQAAGFQALFEEEVTLDSGKSFYTARFQRVIAGP